MEGEGAGVAYKAGNFDITTFLRLLLLSVLLESVATGTLNAVIPVNRQNRANSCSDCI